MIAVMGSIWQVFLETAPWLLLGLVLAGLIKAFLPAGLLEKHLREDGIKSSIKAALIGVPLPLCSCGVLPTAIGLRKQGASKPATLSFLISTPETSVDSIILTYSLMGPLMAVFRPLAAVASALVAAILSLVIDPVTSNPKSKANGDEPAKTGDKAASSCCSSQRSSCDATSRVKPVEPGVMERLRNGFNFAFKDILEDVAGWLIVGIVIAGVVLAWLPEDFFARFGDGFAAMLLMLLVGIPLYICATASTPLAASLLMTGMSPGAVLVFLLAGPATNFGGMALVVKELGWRSLFAYLTGISSVALASGWLLNQLWDTWGMSNVDVSHIAHSMLPHWIQLASGVFLLLMLVRIYWPVVQKRLVGKKKSDSQPQGACCSKKADEDSSGSCH